MKEERAKRPATSWGRIAEMIGKTTAACKSKWTSVKKQPK
jgi:hypothetical protein